MCVHCITAQEKMFKIKKSKYSSYQLIQATRQNYLKCSCKCDSILIYADTMISKLHVIYKKISTFFNAFIHILSTCVKHSNHK